VVADDSSRYGFSNYDDRAITDNQASESPYFL
jgi:hypothetical protein